MHVPRLCYMRRSACAPHSLTAPLFPEQNIKHFVGPDLGPNCLLNLFVTASFFFFFLGGGEGVTSVSQAPTLGPALLIVLAADKGTGLWLTDMFEIKEADYQTTCCCCFKTRVARGGHGAQKRT